MKILMLLLLTVSCAQIINPPLIDKANCKNTCMLRDKEYKGFDEDVGCFCADRVSTEQED